MKHLGGFGGLALASLLLAACTSSNESTVAVPAPPATNDDGSVTTGVVTAVYDAVGGDIPLPNDLLLSGTTDLTLNIPVDPTDPAAGPTLALNELDGWGTSTVWQASFNAPIDPSTVIPGDTVRWFEVRLSTVGGPVVEVVRELQAGVEYTAVASDPESDRPSVVIVPLRPLQEITTYMAVLTAGITDPAGNNATPSQTYFFGKEPDPLVDASGNSTTPLLDNATAQALEPLRVLINSQLEAAESQGVDPERIVLSFTATTQSITVPLLALRSTLAPSTAQVAPTGFTTNDAIPEAPGTADIFVGFIDLPYYLASPTPENPTAPLEQEWQAFPGNYVPPFDQLGLDPTSTAITFANPIAMMQSVQSAPLLVTVPNAASGQTRPEAGWPVVIFYPGVTQNRLNAIAIADALAAAGFVSITIDQPLHGVVDPESPFYIENTPFGAIADERTFDLDLVNNDTLEPGPDGRIDPSGNLFFSFGNLLVSRDNARQAQIDLSTVALTIPSIDLDGDTLPDLDAARIGFIGQSFGAMQGIPFLTIEPLVNVGSLSVPGGQIFNFLPFSGEFGDRVLGLLAQVGLVPGTAEFDAFIFAGQSVVDSADPINWIGLASLQNSILVQEVLNDAVIPNTVPGAPLAGGLPLPVVGGLRQIDETTTDPSGLDVYTIFNQGDHGALLLPEVTTPEVQGQAVSMIASDGTQVVIQQPEFLVPAPEGE